MTSRTARTIVLATAMVATSAAAQVASDPRLAGKLDARTRAAVVALVDSAKLVGLPTEPLIDKALEGASKRAPGPRILNAVRDMAHNLGVARRALGPSGSEAEVMAFAVALRSGVSPKQLEAIRAARPTRLAVSLTVLSDMVLRGVPTDTAAKVVLALTNIAATDEQLLAFRGNVELDINAGRPAAVAASTRGEQLEQVIAAAQLPNNGATSGSALPSGRGNGRAQPNLGLPGQAVGAAASVGSGDAPVQPPSRPLPPPRGKPKKKP